MNHIPLFEDKQAKTKLSYTLNQVIHNNQVCAHCRDRRSIGAMAVWDKHYTWFCSIDCLKRDQGEGAVE